MVFYGLLKIIVACGIRSSKYSSGVYVVDMSNNFETKKYKDNQKY